MDYLKTICSQIESRRRRFDAGLPKMSDKAVMLHAAHTLQGSDTPLSAELARRAGAEQRAECPCGGVLYAQRDPR